MKKPWSEIEKRALDDWRFMETLHNQDKQLLYAFKTFNPPIAERKHLILRMKKEAVRELLEAIGEPGGVWLCYDRIPFDEHGRIYVQHVFDDSLFPERFRLWALPKNQEVVWEFAEERYDHQAFSAIFPAYTAPDVVRQIQQLDPFRYVECVDGFLRLLPKLGWTVIMLRPHGDFGILVVDNTRADLVRKVARRLRSKNFVCFTLTKSGDRYVWPGPTEWCR